MRTYNVVTGLLLAVSLGGCQAPPAPASSTTAPVTTQPPTTTPKSIDGTAPAVAASTPTSVAPLVLRLVPNRSKASYLVNEKWLREDVTELVIASTRGISGELTLASLSPLQVHVGAIIVDLHALASSDADRDEMVRDAYLHTGRYRWAMFETKAIEGLPAVYLLGQEVSFRLNGDLTVRDVAHPTSFQVTARFDGRELTGIATTDVRMSAFNITPPSKTGITSVEDKVTIKLTFVAEP